MRPASAAPSTVPIYRDYTATAAMTGIVPAGLACDVSFIGDDSAAPEALVARQIERLKSPRAAALMWDIFDRLRAEYDGGAFVPHPSWVLTRIRHALSAAGLELPAQQTEALFRFFDQVNVVLFQHQTLSWVAEAQLKLNLFGAGWEQHPYFGKYACGPIESDAMRVAVYRASRINLQAGPYGAINPRLVEGIIAGGFFLMRFAPADLLERFFPPILDFCQQCNITTGEQLLEEATPGVRLLMEFAARTIGVDLATAFPNLVFHLRESADAGYTRSAAAVWPQYPAVSFASKDELIGRVGRYLYDVPERRKVAEEMRRQLVGRFNHVRVNRQLLEAPVTRAEVAA
ncbi:MAG TPA: hypothetical protein VER17_07175 [Tepidisphaeraceae bacterium]|nr:hypothetical protein [Tepidisphaeraceae bacterium]